MKKYFQARKDSFVKKILRNIIEHKHDDLVKNYDLENWKELVVLLLTHAKEDR